MQLGDYRAARRLGGAFVVTLVGAVCIVGVMHSVAGRRLWSALSRGSQSCPFGGSSGVTPAQAAAQQRATDGQLRGTAVSKGRPALGFILGQTRRPEVERWARQAGATCHVVPGDHSLECAGLSSAALNKPQSSELSTLFAHFDSAGVLHEVAVITTVESAQNAVAVASGLIDTISTQAGAPTHTTGQADAAYLARGGLAQTAAEFRFSDFYARIAATNMGRLGYYTIAQTYRLLAE